MPDDGPAGERFRTWDAIASTVVTAGRDALTVVVLDDLHWADASSLRVLRHLLQVSDTQVAGAAPPRLLVVGTWRAHPEPAGPLAEVAEAFARRHAVRLDLTGLSVDGAADLLAAVVGRAPETSAVRTLEERTEGNPFFLVEYARLLEQGGTALDAPPTAVGDVLRRRLAALPEATRTLLVTAAVLGRAFGLAPLAAVSGLDEDDVLDALDAAVAAGLVVEDGVDRFRFSHALVRDAAAQGLSASRRARLHASAARVVESLDGAGTDAARHWLAAGPAHAPRAWRSALAAARQSRALHAHEELRDLLRDAVAAQALDPAATWRERYDLLLELAGAHRLLADWDGLTEAAETAHAVARDAGDRVLAAEAAVQPGLDAPWQPRVWGEVHVPTVRALSGSLEVLPRADSPLRLRLLCALANELYYAADRADERADLVEEALAMSRRLGDPALEVMARHTFFTASWRPSTAGQRLEHVREGARLAVTIEDGPRALAARAGLATLEAVALFELGRVPELVVAVERADALATEAQDPYLQLIVDGMQAPWHALSGRPSEAATATARMQRLAERVTLAHARDAVTGVELVVASFGEQPEAVLGTLAQMDARTTLPNATAAATMLLRAGVPEAARQIMEQRPVRFGPEDWYSLLHWSTACEVAAGLGMPDLGARAYELAAPYAGMNACAGSGVPLGPMDSFLALGAYAAGEPAVAARHADDAEALCRQWQVPLVARWLRGQRDLFGF